MLIGHQKNIAFLKQLLATPQLAMKSFLFYGQEHLGKTTVAEWLIKKLLATASLANHPDFIRLSPSIDQKTNKKSAISVADLREVLPKLNSSPLIGRYHALLIEDAEYLEEAGWNLMLKTLEESPPSAIIILVAHAIVDIPKTVLSRVLKLQFLAVPPTEMKSGLEALQYDQARVKEVMPLSLGRPGVMIEALNKKSQSQEIGEIIALFNKSLAERLLFFEQKSKDELLSELDRLLLFCRDAILTDHEMADFLVWPELANQIKVWNSRVDYESRRQLIKKIMVAKQQLAYNANPRLVIENILFSF